MGRQRLGADRPGRAAAGVRWWDAGRTLAHRVPDRPGTSGGGGMTPSGCRDFFRAAPMGRREFLRAGSLGLFGLGLPQLLATRPAPRPRAKACILLFMWGGPAQQDTWDPKPNAPAEYRGEF